MESRKNISAEKEMVEKRKQESMEDTFPAENADNPQNLGEEKKPDGQGENKENAQEDVKFETNLKKFINKDIAICQICQDQMDVENNRQCPHCAETWCKKGIEQSLSVKQEGPNCKKQISKNTITQNRFFAKIMKEVQDFEEKSSFFVCEKHQQDIYASCLECKTVVCGVGYMKNHNGHRFEEVSHILNDIKPEVFKLENFYFKESKDWETKIQDIKKIIEFSRIIREMLDVKFQAIQQQYQTISDKLDKKDDIMKKELEVLEQIPILAEEVKLEGITQVQQTEDSIQILQSNIRKMKALKEKVLKAEKEAKQNKECFKSIFGSRKIEFKIDYSLQQKILELQTFTVKEYNIELEFYWNQSKSSYSTCLATPHGEMVDFKKVHYSLDINLTNIFTFKKNDWGDEKKYWEANNTDYIGIEIIKKESLSSLQEAIRKNEKKEEMEATVEYYIEGQGSWLSKKGSKDFFYFDDIVKFIDESNYALC